MNISASDVMKLRETTGLGMMTCKKALMESNGNVETAMDNLRKQGQATAAKRASKDAKEGKVNIIVRGSDALIYEVNSETDFVARNDDFLTFVKNLGQLLLEKKPAGMTEALAMSSPLFNGQTTEAKLMEIVGKIGEKISFRRFKIVSINTSKETLYTYNHGNGKIGVIVTIAADSAASLQKPPVAELGKDLAMQVAASKPLAVSRDDVSKDIVAKEKEIYHSQVQTSGKPEKIWDKIVEGKLQKFYNQVVLLEQEYIRDPEITVTTRINQTEKEVGAALTVTSFVRFELGVGE